MKKIIQIFIYFLFASAAQAQEFSFQLFFSDAGGNKDTITLGYDPLATNSIDAAFGEVNIITVPRKKSLDVRISDELKNRESNLTIVGTFHTKKQIVPHNCKEANEYANQEIDIATTHWPVTVTWDPLLFNEFCRNGSVFTSMKPGGWFDTGSPSNLGVQILNKGGSKTFKSNAGELFVSRMVMIPFQFSGRHLQILL